MVLYRKLTKSVYYIGDAEYYTEHREFSCYFSHDNNSFRKTPHFVRGV